MIDFNQQITFFNEVTRIDIVKMLIPAFLTFIVGILITPLITRQMFKHELWKKKSVSKTVDGKKAHITAKLHGDESRKVPRMGGLVIVLSIMIVSGLLWLPSVLFDVGWIDELNYFNRAETWLPVVGLLGGFLVGVMDDLAVVGKIGAHSKSVLGKAIGGGIPLRTRIGLVALIGLFCGWWFFAKLDVTSVYIPFWQELEIGWLIIPLFVIVMTGTYSGGIIDGIDGLAGGVMASIFTTYALISFLQGSLDLATLCFAIVAGTLAFLWFNIPPARFYMSETGMMALTVCLSIIAFSTNTVALVPIIAFPLLVTSGSVIIQVLSKKLRNGKKVFLVSPLHNNYQAHGWPGHKVTMRYWVFTQFTALGGLIVYVLGYQF